MIQKKFKFFLAFTLAALFLYTMISFDRNIAIYKNYSIKVKGKSYTFPHARKFILWRRENMVFKVLSFPSSANENFFSCNVIIALKNCTVSNKNNWTCQGMEDTDIARKKFQTGSVVRVIDGVFSEFGDAGYDSYSINIPAWKWYLYKMKVLSEKQLLPNNY